MTGFILEVFLLPGIAGTQSVEVRKKPRSTVWDSYDDNDDDYEWYMAQGAITIVSLYKRVNWGYENECDICGTSGSQWSERTSKCVNLPSSIIFLNGETIHFTKLEIHFGDVAETMETTQLAASDYVLHLLFWERKVWLFTSNFLEARCQYINSARVK